MSDPILFFSALYKALQCVHVVILIIVVIRRWRHIYELPAPGPVGLLS